MGESADGRVKAFFAGHYRDVHALAERALRRERANHTLSPTEIVHLAYTRLVDQRNLAAADRATLLGAAAVAVRRILIDHARKRRREPPSSMRIPLDSAVLLEVPEEIDWLTMDDALDELEAIQPLARQVAELRIFLQSSNADAAEVLGIGTETARTAWVFARAWLHRRLKEG